MSNRSRPHWDYKSRSSLTLCKAGILINVYARPTVALSAAPPLPILDRSIGYKQSKIAVQDISPRWQFWAKESTLGHA